MAISKKNSRMRLNIMFTCIGRRVSLLKAFQSAAKKLKIKGVFIGTDTTALSPALRLCDKQYIVKPVKDKGYLKELLEVVRDNKVDLLVPTVDLDLKLLSNNKDKFAELGCVVLVSEPRVVEICQDKRQTYKFLHKNRFDSPETMSVKRALSKQKLNWPCFIKPWDGYASRGNAVVENRNELIFYGRKVPNPIVQEFIEAIEYTCDVYVDFDMNVRCVVPRRRIEVRGGEVSKGQIVKNKQIMQKTGQVVEKLGAGPGVITIQLFVTNNGQMKFIEINPRFGGGVPLSIRAGANFPKWIMQELIGNSLRIRFNGFKDKLIMLRYDSEVWVDE
jgi:carbamoyl-phosphate synthase large subunit